MLIFPMLPRIFDAELEDDKDDNEGCPFLSAEVRLDDADLLDDHVDVDVKTFS